MRNATILEGGSEDSRSSSTNTKHTRRGRRVEIRFRFQHQQTQRTKCNASNNTAYIPEKLRESLENRFSSTTNTNSFATSLLLLDGREEGADGEGKEEEDDDDDEGDEESEDDGNSSKALKNSYTCKQKKMYEILASCSLKRLTFLSGLLQDCERTANSFHSRQKQHCHYTRTDHCNNTI